MSIKKSGLIFIWILVLFFGEALLLPQAGQNLQEGRFKLQEGFEAGDEKLLKEARDLFISVLMKEGKGNVYILYYIGLTDYRLTSLYISKNDNKKAKWYLEEGKRYLKKVQEVEPSIAESYALFASLLGMEIGLDPLKSHLGPKINEYFSKAFEKEKQNPRVNLLQGISLLYTPKIFGGGAKSAVEYLEKSILFYKKKTSKGSLETTWGIEEVYTYLGIAYREMDKIGKAKEAFKKAVDANPNYKHALIELKKTEKK